ncbi:hypothetical protein EGW08_017907 [Elysia chlorotica]|uniref:Uncharacterized protein n=1 Tax=Elysia chlorotica TaxID=188477 RepID=A0A433SYI5_ELYCH|nr:hypothetical protein EGW08_017907 [Elysia chlorotica]
MISPAHKAPLTLCKAAVSSPSSLSSSSSSSFSIASSFLPSSFLLQKSHSSSLSSLVTSSSVSLLLFLSCLLLPLRSLVSSPRRGSGSPSERVSLCIILMLALTALPVGSFPIPSPKDSENKKGGAMPPNLHSGLTSYRTVSISMEGANGRNKNSSSSKSGYQPKVELGTSYQGDQPPRKTVTKGQDFHSNTRKTQGRAFYLRSDNNQYLQIYNGIVSGTWKEKPVLGLLESYSHKGFFLIKHRYSKKYLCMNEQFNLYLEANADVSNCHIRHEMLDGSLGLFKNVFIFDKYERYLGIDCDPVSWVDIPEMENSPVRFWEDPITAEEALEQEKLIKIRGETGKDVLGVKCTSQKERKRLLREEKMKRLQRKLRQRWCWSLPRMLNNKEKYIEKCEQKHKKRCKSTSSHNSKSMTTVATFTFRGGERETDSECVCDLLREMLDRPNEAKHTCLNQKVLLWVQNQAEESGKALEPNEPLISKVASMMVRHFNGIARRMRETRCMKKHRLSRSHCRKKSRGIKINGVLKQFQEELVITPDQSPARKPSKAFRTALRGLDGSTRKHRVRQRLARQNRQRRKQSPTSSMRPDSSSGRPKSSSRRSKVSRKSKASRRSKNSRRRTSSHRLPTPPSDQQSPG